MPPRTGRRTTFPPFSFDWKRGQLFRGESLVRLRPKTLSLLRVLLTAAGQIVFRDDLMETLWPDATVTDVVLNVCIAELRRALGDDRSHPRFVETVHGLGFRFIAHLLSDPEPVEVNEIPADGGSRRAEGPESATMTAPGRLIAGRDGEIDRLLGCWRRAAKGSRQVIMVTGDPGIGKTALLEAFLDRLTLGAPAALPLVARGWCFDLRVEGEPLLPVLDALGSLCSGPFGAEVLTQIRTSAPALLLHLPVPLEAAEADALRLRQGTARREAMLRDVIRGITAIARARPLVLALEDLHWADSSTVDLIAAMAQQRDAAPLLVVGTARPAEAIVKDYPRRLLHLRPEGDDFEHLALERLDGDQVRDYLCLRFRSKPLARALAPWLAAGSDGHPLFMVVLLDDLIQSGTLRLVGSRWRLAPERLPREVGPSLVRLLRERFETFAPLEREAISVAAVAGHGFAAQAVAAGLGSNVEDAEALCQRLVDVRHVLEDCGPAAWPDGTTAQSYRFRHAVYRQVAETMLPSARRRALHARIGERLAEGFGQSVGDLAVELAAHFRAAGLAARAFEFGRLAARRAADRGGYREAVAHMGDAREALLSLPESETRSRDELALLSEFAPVVVANGGLRSPESTHVLARMHELIVRTDQTRLHCSTLSTLAVTWRQRGEIEAAEAAGNEALRLAQELEDPALEIVAQQLVGSNRFHSGAFSAARDQLERCIALGAGSFIESENVLAALSLTSARGYLAVLLWLTGEPDAARTLAEQTVRASTGTIFPPVSGMAHVLAAWTFVLLRDFDRTLALVSADPVVGQTSFPLWGAIASVVRGWVRVHRGEDEAGIAELDAGYQAYLDLQGEASAFDYQLLRTEAYLTARRLTQARDIAAGAFENLRIYKQGYFAPELHRVHGEILWALEDPRSREEALETWRTGLALAREWGAVSSASRLSLALERAARENPTDSVARAGRGRRARPGAS